MTERSAVRIAVVADSPLQRHILQQFLVKQGYQVVLNSDPQHLDQTSLEGCATDLWLYESANSNDSECQALEYFLAEPNAPVLFGEGVAPARGSEDYPRWERSLLKKILQMTEYLTQGNDSHVVRQRLPTSNRLAQIDLPYHFKKYPVDASQPAKQVWLLAASMGGPQAVKDFLDALPHGLPLGFLYAQHIDASFEGYLPQAVGRHSQWPVRLLEDYKFVRAGEVVIVPIKYELTFTINNSLQVLDRAWAGPYQPSIEQMMRTLAQSYGPACGVIMFSGMGDDGSRAAPYVQQQGAQIWTQSADSCACSNMPDSVKATGCSVFSASPQGLAYELVQYLLHSSQKNNDTLERKMQ